MIERMANDLVEQIAKEQLISERQREYYIYACISIMEKITTIGTICIIGFMRDMFVHTLVFLVFFLALRKRTGGYHANSFVQCYLGTVIAYLIVAKVNETSSEHPQLFFGILVVAICIIEIIGAVNHPNMHMNVAELLEAKKASRISALIEGCIIFSLAYAGVDMIFISYMSAAIILCATLLCTAKILKQEISRNEKK